MRSVWRPSRFALLDERLTAVLRLPRATYARVRADAGTIKDDGRWQSAVGEAARMGYGFGNLLFATLRPMPSDPRGPVLVQAYNDMMDLATARHAARKARLPKQALLLLAFYCCAGTTMRGYTRAASGKRHVLASAIFFTLLANAFVTILDLDRPRGGAILVPQDEPVAVSRAIS